MNRDPLLYIDDIVEAIAAIREYTSGMSRETFMQNRVIQDAVIRRIEIIGEAARQMPESLKRAHPDIPWADIVGMRNRLIHGYFGVQLDRVWLVVQQDIPVLETQIQRLRGSLDD